jgi:DNA-binding LacI/PurR family transcriptional regulator
VTKLPDRWLSASADPLLCHAADLDAERTFFKERASRRFCGAVLMNPPRRASYGDLRRVMDRGTVVVSAEPVPELGLPHVTVDRGAGAEGAVRNLRKWDGSSRNCSWKG